MTEALRLWARLLYAPGRGLRLAAERRRLLSPILFALLTQTAFGLIFFGHYYIAAALQVARIFPPDLGIFRSSTARWAVAATASFVFAAVTTVLIGLVFIPVATFISTLRTGSVSLSASLQRHYIPVAAAIFSALGLGQLWGLLVALVLRATGAIGVLVRKILPLVEQSAKDQPQIKSMVESIGAEAFASKVWFDFIAVVAVMVALWWALRIGFNSSWARAFLALVVAGLATLSMETLFGGVVNSLVGGIILTLMSFLVLRAYFLNTVERQQLVLRFAAARREADSNPHDPQAQAEFGKLLMERGDLAGARGRFQRAVESDAEDWSAHFHLGRVARREGRWADAIAHFVPVVTNEFDHSQYEVWREVGGTYLGAGQFADAVDALEKFLDHRPHDAEGWYLLGHAQAGVGNRIEAAAAMHACITAVEGLVEPDEIARGWRTEAENYLRTVGR